MLSTQYSVLTLHSEVRRRAGRGVGARVMDMGELDMLRLLLST